MKKCDKDFLLELYKLIKLGDEINECTNPVTQSSLRMCASNRVGAFGPLAKKLLQRYEIHLKEIID